MLHRVQLELNERMREKFGMNELSEKEIVHERKYAKYFSR